MSKIVFCKPPLPLEKLYGKLSKGGNEMPPLGLCYLAGVTMKNNFETSIVDSLPLGLNFKETVNEIIKQRPKYVGITAVTISIGNAARLALMLKEKDRNLVIIIGGPHVTAVPEQTLKKFPQFDIGVISEGEITIVELLSALENNENLRLVKGIIFRENGNLYSTERREFIKDLDTLPFPAWDLLPDITKYYQPAADSLAKLPSTSLVTSRGCYGKCTFCDQSVFGNRCRANSAEYVMRMIKHLYYDYGIKDIHIFDDNFTLFRPRLKELCNMIIDEKMDLSLFCMARVDTVTPEILKLLRKAGFWQIAWGIESGSQKILDNIKKNVTVRQNEETLWWSRRAGIRNQGYLMLGNFGETKETVMETFDFIKRAPIDDFHITYFMPFPGSPAYEEIDKYGTFDRNWDRVSEFFPNFVPNDLTVKQLLRYHKLAYMKFYLRPKIIFYYILKIIRHPQIASKLITGFISFLAFIRQGNVKKFN